MPEGRTLLRLSYGGCTPAAKPAAYPKLGENRSPFWPSIFRGSTATGLGWQISGLQRHLPKIEPHRRRLNRVNAGRRLVGGAAPIPDAWRPRCRRSSASWKWPRPGMIYFFFFLLYSPPPPRSNLCYGGGGEVIYRRVRGGGNTRGPKYSQTSPTNEQPITRKPLPQNFENRVRETLQKISQPSPSKRKVASAR